MAIQSKADGSHTTWTVDLFASPIIQSTLPFFDLLRFGKINITSSAIIFIASWHKLKKSRASGRFPGLGVKVAKIRIKRTDYIFTASEDDL